MTIEKPLPSSSPAKTPTVSFPCTRYETIIPVRQVEFDIFFVCGVPKRPLESAWKKIEIINVYVGGEHISKNIKKSFLTVPLSHY